MNCIAPKKELHQADREILIFIVIFKTTRSLPSILPPYSYFPLVKCGKEYVSEPTPSINAEKASHRGLCPLSPE